VVNENSQAGPGRVAKILSMDLEELQAFRPSYEIAFIKKRSGGKRILHIPDPNTKHLQRTLNRNLFSNYRLHPSCCGFVKGKSIVENATPHINQQAVIKLDIVDFFPSTTAIRIHHYFTTTGWSGKAARLLTRLVCHENGLPQGAPTSPLLSNIVNKLMDHRLSRLAEARQAQYTRYADDLTFSFGFYDRKRVHSLLRSVGMIVRDFGYKLNTRKKQILRSHRRQSVTGIVVNEKANLPRKTRRWLRSVHHRIQTGGSPTLSRQEFNGWISLLRMIHPQDPLVGQVLGTVPERRVAPPQQEPVFSDPAADSGSITPAQESKDEVPGAVPEREVAAPQQEPVFSRSTPALRTLGPIGHVEFRPKKLGSPSTLHALGIQQSTDAITPTQYFSCYLVKEKGYSVPQIAKNRELTEKVIWKHLAEGVRASMLPPTPLTSKQVIERIYTVIKKRFQGRPPRIGVLYRECNREVPYGEIRIAVGYLSRPKEATDSRETGNKKMMKLCQLLSSDNPDPEVWPSVVGKHLTISFLIQSHRPTFTFLDIPESYSDGKILNAVLTGSDLRLEIYMPSEKNALMESLQLPKTARAKVQIGGWDKDSQVIQLLAVDL
jgi:RNA-directed DNA polymerase